MEKQNILSELKCEPRRYSIGREGERKRDHNLKYRYT